MEFDPSLKDNIACTAYMHTEYRSVLGQINWLQSRTQFQAVYLFSRCASAFASPKIEDWKRLDKLVKTNRAGLNAENIKLCFRPLKGKPRGCLP